MMSLEDEGGGEDETKRKKAAKLRCSQDESEMRMWLEGRIRSTMPQQQSMMLFVSASETLKEFTRDNFMSPNQRAWDPWI